MGEDAEADLGELTRFGAGTEVGAEASLVPAEGTLGLGSSAVLTARESAFHQTAVPSLGPAPAVVAGVERDHRAADAQLGAAQGVVVLGVVPLVRDDAACLEVRRGLTYRRPELGRVLTRAARGRDPRDELRRGVEHGGELGPGRVPHIMGQTPCTPSEVHRGVPDFQTG